MVCVQESTRRDMQGSGMRGLRRSRIEEYLSASDLLNRNDAFEAPSSDPTHLHKYLYAGANPIVSVDPNGSDFSLTGLAVSAGIGAVLGAIGGGTYAAYTGKSIWKGALIGAGLGAVAGAGIYLAFTGFAAIQTGALQRFFLDPRTFTTISRQYWQEFGPAVGRSLHHWLIPQRWTWVPQAIRNAGFNLLEMPKILPGSLGLNQWMGFAVRWGGQRLVVAMIVENGVRILIPVSAVATYHAGKWLGNELADEAIDFVEDGATATPLRLTPEEERQMQEDAGKALQQEVDTAGN